MPLPEPSNEDANQLTQMVVHRGFGRSQRLLMAVARERNHFLVGIKASLTGRGNIIISKKSASSLSKKS